MEMETGWEKMSCMHLERRLRSFSSKICEPGPFQVQCDQTLRKCAKNDARFLWLLCKALCILITLQCFANEARKNGFPPKNVTSTPITFLSMRFLAHFN